MSSNLTKRQRFDFQRAKTLKITAFTKKFVGNKSFDSVKAQHWFCWHVLFLSRRVEWIIIWPKKVILKNWLTDKVMNWSEKVMLQVSRSVSSAWTYLWCFDCSTLSLSKGIAENLLAAFRDLKWPRRQTAMFDSGYQVYACNLMSESVSNGFS